MAQSLEVNIKTTSDVPQAMDKAKAATSGFQNQLNDIGKKFSNSFKDIALGFIAPMILIQSAISFISGAIAKAKQEAKEAYDFAVKGESKYLDQTTIKLAQDRRAKEDDAKEQEMAKKAKQEELEAELKTREQRSSIADEIGGFRGFRLKFGLDANSAEAMAKDKDVQDIIARRVAARSSGTAVAAAAITSPAGLTGPTSFKTPEGFGNIVGVGANPVMEAMAEQTELARQQLAELQKLNAKGTDTQTDFTKDSK